MEIERMDKDGKLKC